MQNTRYSLRFWLLGAALLFFLGEPLLWAQNKAQEEKQDTLQAKAPEAEPEQEGSEEAESVDVLRLKDGRRLIGKIVSIDFKSVSFRTLNGKVERHLQSKLKRLCFGKPERKCKIESEQEIETPDVLSFRDGRQLIGKVLSIDFKSVFFRTLSGEIGSYLQSRLKRICFGKPDRKCKIESKQEEALDLLSFKDGRQLSGKVLSMDFNSVFFRTLDGKVGSHLQSKLKRICFGRPERKCHGLRNWRNYLWRSALLPGWGQWEERKLLSASIFASLFGSLSLGAVHFNNLALQYKSEANEAIDERNDLRSTSSAKLPVDTGRGKITELKKNVEDAVKTRNALLAGSLLVYLLQLYHAYNDGFFSSSPSNAYNRSYENRKAVSTNSARDFSPFPLQHYSQGFSFDLSLNNGLDPKNWNSPRTLNSSSSISSSSYTLHLSYRLKGLSF